MASDRRIPSNLCAISRSNFSAVSAIRASTKPLEAYPLPAVNRNDAVFRNVGHKYLRSATIQAVRA
jgi:hypothetical protein